ncbi:MAG: branched-chain amino acid ABC transporter substrate-binding protein [Candidatus Methylomirabilis sp.]
MSAKPTLGSENGRNERRPRRGLFPAILALLLLGIQQESAVAKTETTSVITIGVVGPMSGGMAQLGRYVRQAVEFQAEEWNEKGGLLGRRIQLLVEDDRDDPVEAVSAARRLVQAGIWGVIGHLTSAASLPASAVYHAAGIPQITPSSTDPRLTEQRFRNLFRTCGRDDQQGRVAAEFVLDTLDPRRVVVLHDMTPYGKALAETFRREIARKDRRLLVATLVLLPGGKNMGSVVDAVRAKEPDVVYFGGIFRDGGLLIKRLRERGVKARLVSGDGMIGTEFINVAGEAAATGTYLTFAPTPLRMPSAEAVIKRFQDRHGTIGPYTLYAYDAAGALFSAMAKAKPKSPSHSQLRRVSQTLHGMTYKGALGRLRWDRKGDLISQPYVIYQARKGGSFQGWFEQVTGRQAEL